MSGLCQGGRLAWAVAAAPGAGHAPGRDVLPHGVTAAVVKENNSRADSSKLHLRG